jgi:hypothetical protein
LAEILLPHYNLFVSRHKHAHLITNLNSSKIEEIYGTRLLSLLR